ncbi:hypothetical protein ACMHYJ_05265 [Castellaniella hirudinis]|uniref:hypothetical protein n=1 Tax=Castellaniella hirudinis TaxID=1144617 RepID=UPI0039C30DCE
MNTIKLSLQIAIAEKAVELYRLEESLRSASADLRNACSEFRHKHNGGNYVQRDSDMHEQMREVTGLEFETYNEAKRNVRNAKRRLDTAIRASLGKGVRP